MLLMFTAIDFLMVKAEAMGLFVALTDRYNQAST
jgi:hypothetical protein